MGQHASSDSPSLILGQLSDLAGLYSELKTLKLCFTEQAVI